MHIGLFDSGVGGLTVLKELVAAFPKSQFTYLGDTARLPYGNKAPETLKKYSQENMEFLANQKVDVIVIACHSASSVCLDISHFHQTIPVFNVIAPSCQEALKKSKSKKIAVLATKATIKSQVYPNYIKQLDDEAQVIGQECPLLVPLVEEGLIEDEITEMVLKRYLKEPLAAKVDTILLGCTHYPILQTEIAKLTPGIELINPAETVVAQLKEREKPHSLTGKVNIYLTDHSPHFINHAHSLLGSEFQYSINYFQPS